MIQKTQLLTQRDIREQLTPLHDENFLNNALEAIEDANVGLMTREQRQERAKQNREQHIDLKRFVIEDSIFENKHRRAQMLNDTLNQSGA